jgi:hypothetical protein
MATADLSFITFLSPILVFFLVAALIGALLMKMEILGKNVWLNVFIGIFIAAIFLSAVSLQKYVLTIVPWFATILVALFFVLLVLGLAGKDAAFLGKATGIIFFIAMLFVILVAGIVIFSDYIIPYLPWGYGYNRGDPAALGFFSWLYSPRVAGAVLLIVAAVIVAWILVRVKK